ncbi:hypothetical protein BDBG_07731 [Blastomyces gilchristii SLH14081]|uniref:Uncharacterized protein n=1 Tax=Blastomyces gilchristii (strain SLH14081) TaxID=559298 RepID=A0A179UWF2_BLAGS|nr:uncharacterized protein BDBG_07731 [Blastomyces gilchristii SLH14081]OAT12384.1 hypothetical protein BDBG_07731 [Blastomyces gilchristii SLH14081]
MKHPNQLPLHTLLCTPGTRDERRRRRRRSSPCMGAESSLRKGEEGEDFLPSECGSIVDIIGSEHIEQTQRTLTEAADWPLSRPINRMGLVGLGAIVGASNG